MISQTLYKIVSYSYRSIDGYYNEKLELLYQLNQKVIPIAGKIFCYKTLTDARQNYCSGIILKGIGTNPYNPKFVCQLKKQYVQFWKEIASKKQVTTRIVKPPSGTVLVDSFTPTEIVI